VGIAFDGAEEIDKTPTSTSRRDPGLLFPRTRDLETYQCRRLLVAHGWSALGMGQAVKRQIFQKFHSITPHWDSIMESQCDPIRCRYTSALIHHCMIQCISALVYRHSTGHHTPTACVWHVPAGVILVGAGRFGGPLPQYTRPPHPPPLPGASGGSPAPKAAPVGH